MCKDFEPDSEQGLAPMINVSERVAASDDDLQQFRERVKELYRRATPYDDGRKPTMSDLAHAVGLSRVALSNHLNGTDGAWLTGGDAQAIVRTLAAWGAIQTQAEALELLALVNCPPFTPAQWQAPPLDQLLRAEVSRSSDGWLPAPAPRSSNLPRPVTAIIGREREASTVQQLLTQHRLVTLVGVGGSGKTRLALEVAARMSDRFTDGVYFVGLATIQDPALVASTIAQTLDLRGVESSSQSRLQSYLATRQILLVLDNCEQVMPASLVSDLLTAADGLRVLATSRERLHLYGEQKYNVPPLALPEPGRHLSLAELAASPALTLFVERARLLQADFTLTEDNALIVAAICARLDGLPLAIELVAAQVEVFSPGELLTGLSDHPLQLTDRAGGQPQPSLRSVLDWSYNRLTPAEQHLFRSLSVFVGGCTLAAAAVVASILPAELPALLHALLDKSLLRRGEMAGESRFIMLETMAAYAAEQSVLSGTAAVAHQRHALHYQTLVNWAEAELRGAEQSVWMNRFERELGNLRAARDWLTQAGELEAALQMHTTLLRFWITHGHVSEAYRWLTAALSSYVGEDSVVQARAYNAAGVLARELGEVAAAQSHLQHSVQIARSLGDLQTTTNALGNLASNASEQCDYATASTLYHEVLTTWRELGHQRNVAATLGNLAFVVAETGDFVAAQQMYEESLRILQEVGDEWSTAYMLNNLANVISRQGDNDLARALHKQSLILHQKLGSRAGLAYALEGLAAVAFAEQQPEQVITLLAAADTLRQLIATPAGAADQTRHELALASSRAVLGETAAERLWLKGADLDPNQAVTLALV